MTDNCASCCDRWNRTGKDRGERTRLTRVASNLLPPYSNGVPMNRAVHLTAILLIAESLSCTHWQAQYLDETLNRATQTDVAQRLGPPTETRPSAEGRTIWLYRVVGGTTPPPMGSGEPYCKEYRLMFDAEKILRQWESYRC